MECALGLNCPSAGTREGARVAIGAPKPPYTAPTEIEPFSESPNPLIRVARRVWVGGTEWLSVLSALDTYNPLEMAN